MKMFFKTLPIAIMLLTPLGAHAGNGGNAGNGTSDGKPGCDGGTNPSPDGKFYIPGTKQECNPSDDDRKKLK